MGGHHYDEDEHAGLRGLFGLPKVRCLRCEQELTLSKNTSVPCRHVVADVTAALEDKEN